MLRFVTNLAFHHCNALRLGFLGSIVCKARHLNRCRKYSYKKLNKPNSLSICIYVYNICILKQTVGHCYYIKL